MKIKIEENIDVKFCVLKKLSQFHFKENFLINSDTRGQCNNFFLIRGVEIEEFHAKGFMIFSIKTEGKIDEKFGVFRKLSQFHLKKIS